MPGSNIAFATACALIAVLMAGCTAEPPRPAEPAADAPLRPDPLGLKQLEQLPTAVQVRDCARVVRTSLDLGGWELRHWPVRDAVEGAAFELLYAVRGDEVRGIGRVDDLAALVERYRSAEDYRELMALVERESAAGVDFYTVPGSRLDKEEAAALEARTGVRFSVVHKDDACIIERPLPQSCCGHDRVVRIRERFAPRLYAIEFVEVLETQPPRSKYRFTPERLQQHGSRIRTTIRPGGWELWLAPHNPESRESPASKAIFACKDTEVRCIHWMDELVALAGRIEYVQDALELAQIPARLAAQENLGFDEDNGWVPAREWEYFKDLKDVPQAPSVELTSGGWTVERLVCQFSGVGTCVRAVVIRQGFSGGRVQTTVVRVVKGLIPQLRSYH
ncbi:MAG: hypothetical protein FD180_2269 [Planctomycetota bacterium]|nr:MAG: hypothetical protein FD180_2269 [Planctomycetota bacterium]